MKKIEIKRIGVGYFISYLIIFLITGVPKLLSDSVKTSIEFALNFPLFLTIFPFKILTHYPEASILILTFFFIVYILQRKFFILRKLAFVVIIFITWKILGLFLMLKQAIDF